MAARCGPRDRVKGMLWGALIADALAMPVHWYYNTDNLKRDYGHVAGYLAPKNPHPEAMTPSQHYRPNPENKINFYHDKEPFMSLSDTDQSDADLHPDEHGNRFRVKPDKRTHYHQNLAAGENTSAPRVMMRTLWRTMTEQKRYDSEAYLQAFEKFFLTPGVNKDTYFEKFVRAFFTRRSWGHELNQAAEDQLVNWSVGSHTSMQGVIVVTGTAFAQGLPVEKALELALAHHNLTHRGPVVTRAAKVLVPLLYKLLAGAPLVATAQEAALGTRLPRVKGDELVAKYREHKGPGNIPLPLAHQLHMHYREEPFDAMRWVDSKLPDEKVVGLEGEISSMCYLEHGVPACLYFLCKYPEEYTAPVLANLHVGGDSTGRGAILGALAGAAHGFSSLPENLVSGLYQQEVIDAEINALLDLAFDPAPVFA